MFLKKLALYNFKNHRERSFVFSRKINCVTGINGAGKTNLLDAIYYLCLSKSYFSTTDQQLIRQGADFFRLQGTIEREGTPHEIVFKLPAGRKKELLVDEQPVPKMSRHVGQFPAVMIAPDDHTLITGGSDERRRFLDAAISQVHHDYLEWLIQYNKVLTQRNAALREFTRTQRTDTELLATYNYRLHQTGTQIFEARKKVTAILQPLLQHYYKELSLNREPVRFEYNSQLHEKPLDVLLEEGLRKDLILERTESGIHKDDLDFYIGDNKVKKFGSQGQQKSFVIALKFAEYLFIARAKGFKPLLLIDDIFDKLDNDRSRQLVELVASDTFGQVFITDPDVAHFTGALSSSDVCEVFPIHQS